MVRRAASRRGRQLLRRDRLVAELVARAQTGLGVEPEGTLADAVAVEGGAAGLEDGMDVARVDLGIEIVERLIGLLVHAAAAAGRGEKQRAEPSHGGSSTKTAPADAAPGPVRSWQAAQLPSRWTTLRMICSVPA